MNKTVTPSLKYRAIGRLVATVVDNTDAAILHSSVTDYANVDPMIYTVEHKAYIGSPNRHPMCRSVAERVSSRDLVGAVESLWAEPKHGHHGDDLDLSAEHLDRRVDKLAEHHVRRPLVADVVLRRTTEAMSGRRLPCLDLAA